MEGRQRRSFTDDYKRQAVDLVASSGRSIGSVAKELGLRDSVLRRWVEQRGAGREPTAAARRPTTQATLPSADHAAEIARLQRENERLRMERDILKNFPAPRRSCRNADMSFRFIEDRRAYYPVTILCDVLGVSPAGYYAWRSRPESRRSAANRTLVDDIKRVHRDTSGRLAARVSISS
jgi:transposase